MSNKTINIPLTLSDKFEVAFPDHFIPNGVIDKTKTRLGITYSAFHAKRHSFTVVSNVPIIDDAIADYPYLNLFPVYVKVTVKDIEGYLLSDHTYKRIVSTPESFEKVINAAKNLGMLTWLYDNVFLYMDEFHCYSVDAFRDDILIPFRWLKNFKNQAFGTASLFKSCNPYIMEKQHYKMTYEEKFGKISIVNHHDPKEALNYMLTHREMFTGQVHIFLNTVTGCGEAIMAAGLTEVDANMYCRKDERNEINLGEAKVCFKERPMKDDYKKFNFYSCRYNEGWDLKDDETATIILVTDTRVAHSVVGIEFKGYQAMGRLNYTNMKRYHITNNYGGETMKMFDSVQEKALYNAKKHIITYNNHINSCLEDGIEDDGRLGLMIRDFSSINEQGMGFMDYEKLNQDIYKKYFREPYANIDTIVQTWQSLNYDAEVVAFDIEPITRKLMSDAEINRQIVGRYIEFKEHPERYVYQVAKETLKKYKVEFELLFQAIEILGPEEISQMNYDNKTMKEALINTSNKNAEAKLMLKLIDTFQVGKRYSKKQIKAQLQRFYNDLKIRDLNGSIRTAKATHLENSGLFEVKGCKIPSEGLKPSETGLEILRVNGTIKLAA